MLSNVDESKFGDAQEVDVDPTVSPFEDPQDPQYGIVPGHEEAIPEAFAEASAPPAPDSNLGTPAELRARHGNLRGSSSASFAPTPPQTVSSLNLRGSLNRGAEGDTEQASSTCSELSTDEKLQLHDAQINITSQDVYVLKLTVQTLENKIALPMQEDFPHQAAAKKKKCDLANLSSPEASQISSHSKPAEFALTPKDDLDHWWEEVSHGSGAVSQGGDETDGVLKNSLKDVNKHGHIASVEPRMKYLMRRIHQLSQQLDEKVSAVGFVLEADRVNTLVDNNSRALEEGIQRIQDASDLQWLATDKKLEEQIHLVTQDLGGLRFQLDEQREEQDAITYSIKDLANVTAQHVKTHEANAQILFWALETNQEELKEDLAYVQEQQLEIGFNVHAMQNFSVNNNVACNSGNHGLIPEALGAVVETRGSHDTLPAAQQQQIVGIDAFSEAVINRETNDNDASPNVTTTQIINSRIVRPQRATQHVELEDHDPEQQPQQQYPSHGGFFQIRTRLQLITVAASWHDAWWSTCINEPWWRAAASTFDGSVQHCSAAATFCWTGGKF